MFIRFDINVIKIHFTMKTLKRVNMVGDINEVGATQVLRLTLALGHHGISHLCIDVAGRVYVVRDSTRSNSHKIMV